MRIMIKVILLWKPQKEKEQNGTFLLVKSGFKANNILMAVSGESAPLLLPQ